MIKDKQFRFDYLVSSITKLTDKNPLDIDYYDEGIRFDKLVSIKNTADKINAIVDHYSKFEDGLWEKFTTNLSSGRLSLSYDKYTVNIDVRQMSFVYMVARPGMFFDNIQTRLDGHNSKSISDFITELESVIVKYVN